MRQILDSFYTTIHFTIISVIIIIVIAFLLALILERNFKFKNFPIFIYPCRFNNGYCNCMDLCFSPWTYYRSCFRYFTGLISIADIYEDYSICSDFGKRLENDRLLHDNFYSRVT